MGAPVVIIGPDLVKRLFPTVSPIGREVKMGGLPYTVVGVGESRGSAFGMSFDNYVFAPFRSPVHRLLNRRTSSTRSWYRRPSPRRCPRRRKRCAR